MSKLVWRKDRDGWRAPGYFIQHSRKAKRYYLMTDRFLESPLVLGDYESSAAAKGAADDLERRITG